MTRIDDATLAQNTASDPHASTWLSANAGSGKTRVLTDRVARLLLQGVDPQSILCLTYTKAAASEMQNRLFKRLGDWAMLDDAKLVEGLTALGEDGPQDLDNARTLFARAIDTLGGLKIQTIHSFCAALLRQFPLEARVSPQFRELDEQARGRLIEDVLDGLAQDDPAPVLGLAHHFSGESLTKLAAQIAGSADQFGGTDREEIYALFGCQIDDTPRRIWSNVFEPSDNVWWRSVITALSTQSPSYQKMAARMAAIEVSSPSLDDFQFLKRTFLYQSGDRQNRAKIGGWPQSNHRKAVEATVEWRESIDEFMILVESRQDRELGLIAAEKTFALHDFAAAFLPSYAAAKDAAGVLDFDDLILKARALLQDQGLAWVLYRLDGGINHILVDEAQDTSPAQWQVIDALAAEITSGKGARDTEPRSLFVVGDKKQSIYSFQGADARAFDLMADRFGRQLEHGPKLKRRELTHSFRSSPAILKAVDCVFQDDMAAGIGGDAIHHAFLDQLPGRVDLWPKVPRPDKLEDPAWNDPVDRKAANDPAIVLAEKVACSIQEILDTGTVPGEDNDFRRVTPGDILILVQRRSVLFDNIIRCCKKLDLPIAGADRLKVNAELAVRDLLALLSFLALPEDDLSLATALKSPIFGWTEADLFKLAHARQGYLWAALRGRDTEFPGTMARLRAFRNAADFLRPFELLELILTRFEGRQALVSRLGPEAEDGINELLNQALAYEQSGVPSLTGFLTRANSEDIEIKRQSDTSSDLIRVMTVHGAKGLESSIVFLPDTIRGHGNRHDAFVRGGDGAPLWNVSDDLAPQVVVDAKDIAAEAGAEERQRLLYVAMTRAKHWLIVGGADIEHAPKDNWYDAVAAGLTRAGAKPVSDGDQTVTRLEFGDWPGRLSQKRPRTETILADIEAVFRSDAPDPVRRPRPRAPSDLGGPKSMPGDAGGDTEAAKLRGSRLHRLFEHLPDLPRADWGAAAARLLAGLSPNDTRPLLAEAVGCIDAVPDVFAPGSLAEVDISAQIPALNDRISGAIDRLIVEDARVRAVDFKSNAIAPTRQNEVPEGILRQMGAYLEALEQIWPDKAISIEILWTATGRLMVLEHAIVRNALAHAPTS